MFNQSSCGSLALMLTGPLLVPWRRYVRVRMRSMIVLVLLVGGGLGWTVRSARIQRDAIAAIEKADGNVRYAWGWTDIRLIPGGKPWIAGGLVNLIGVDYFGRITDVWLPSGSTPTDELMVEVGHLIGVRRLGLDGSSLSDTGLAAP